ncbi:hypothetical protein H0H92_008779 [Tricholoma furcatifolium]|nr:hypothetical protein H0H92_008779 [Tricholoma furcatifolium]
MATAETISLNDPHPPHPNAIEAFSVVLPTIKEHILKSRHDWNKHEPRMWSRAKHISNEDLIKFDLNDDLVLVRSASVSYGTIILGKIRIPAINDEEGEGFVHVRIHDPHNRGTDDVMFHSIYTAEGTLANGTHTWRAVQTLDTPLEFFNE